jgi:poly-gamma-glutamate synthesis protein (capsule biosynthesis protein)
VLTLGVDVRAAQREGRRTSPVVTRADWTPMLVGTDGIPRKPSGGDRKRLARVWTQAAACSGLSQTP